MPDSVIPAKAGIQLTLGNSWIPACEGMTFFSAMIIVSAIPVRTLDSRLRGNDERLSCYTHSRHAREGGHPGEFADETMIKAFFSYSRAFCNFLIIKKKP
ncbi:MAG: hypothetical protein HQL87_12190 [Magnetococcales bacterium]|nr:hypothetical protein [Magnetococcales bacterium]